MYNLAAKCLEIRRLCCLSIGVGFDLVNAQIRTVVLFLLRECKPTVFFSTP